MVLQQVFHTEHDHLKTCFVKIKGDAYSTRPHISIQVMTRTQPTLVIKSQTIYRLVTHISRVSRCEILSWLFAARVGFLFVCVFDSPHVCSNAAVRMSRNQKELEI